MDAWWVGIPAARARVACGGEQHLLVWEEGRLDAPDHDDLDAERTLAALGGDPCACAEHLDAWAAHRDDPRVLTLASRGPGDPLRGPGRSRHQAGATMVSLGGLADADAPATAGLPELLRLQGGLAERLVAEVLSGPSAQAPEHAARLTAVLQGRVALALRAWLGLPELDVTVTRAPDGTRPAVTRADDATVSVLVGADWISSVQARGLQVIWGRFVLAASTDDGRTLRLDTIAPDLVTTLSLTLTRG